MKIMTAILLSLKESKLLTQQQMNNCLERIEKTYREENNSRE